MTRVAYRCIADAQVVATNDSRGSFADARRIDGDVGFGAPALAASGTRGVPPAPRSDEETLMTLMEASYAAPTLRSSRDADR